MKVVRESLDICTMFFPFWMLLSLLLLPFGEAVVQSSNDGCPSLYDVTDENLAKSGQLSGLEKCFLDCTRNRVMDMVCEDVDFVGMLSSAQRVPEIDKDFNVYVWNSPSITELESNSFGPMRKRLKTLSLMNLESLINFPMLRDLASLEILRIEGAPNLQHFSPELLPLGLKKLVLVSTAISQLAVDLQEAPPLGNVEEFVFVNHTIYNIRKDFMKIFPNISSVIFVNNTFTLDTISPKSFDPKQNMKRFVMKDNNFSGTTLALQREFMEKIITACKMVDNGSVDLSHNNLPVTKFALENMLGTVDNAEALSLAGNQFGQFFQAEGMFSTFRYLKKLDLSYSNLPKQPGVLKGLAELKFLRLRGNNLGDSSAGRVDIFLGCNATLQTLDLSFNKLMSLPGGSLAAMSGSLTNLQLNDNRFHTDLLDDNDLESFPSPIPSHYNLANLRILNLARTQLKTFEGSWLSGLTNLTYLDLTCNNFKNITKMFFQGLPSSLISLNLAFCSSRLADAPKVEPDAFSTLGVNAGNSSNLTTLILSGGYFKGWIMQRLLSMPNQTKDALQNLDLSNNNIRFLEASHFEGFTQLKRLSVADNLLQNVGKGTFNGLTSLQSLNLSGNSIVSIQPEELSSMNALTFLDLSENHLVNIGSGAFDGMPNLEQLYLNGNGDIVSMQGMFVNGGKRLVHLGITRTGLTLDTYPQGCINRTDLDPLDSLRYFYIDKATAVYVDHGTNSATLRDNIKGSRMLPNDQYAFMCDTTTTRNIPFAYREDPFGVNAMEEQAVPLALNETIGGGTEWSDDFIRLSIQNPFDLSPRTFMGHIPKCYSTSPKNVANVTSSFLCPYDDQKTWRKGVDDKKKDDS